MRIAIIGGGAAGFFSAIAAKENYPLAKVIIFEKSKKLLSKVKISGGGRCNVTNGCTSIKQLTDAYPRGGRLLKKLFPVFDTKDAMEWFESRGVPLVTQPDNCVFPKSQQSQSIIDCFMSETEKLGVKISVGMGIQAITPLNDQLQLTFLNEKHPPQIFDRVIVATGGSPKRKGLEWLEKLGHKIEEPVPSLFTFNMPKESISQLMGIVTENTQVSIQGTKLKSDGSLLITHWGMSGPAILKLSAFGARILNDKGYHFKVQVNWANERNNETVLNHLKERLSEHPKKFLANIHPYQLKERLWLHLLKKCALPEKKKWEELGKKGLNKLVTILTNDSYTVQGKTTFKEEFVTCGGISLDSIHHKTLESTICKNLYFAGEILDIDGITGGYNFQAAWTTGFVAGKLA